MSKNCLVFCSDFFYAANDIRATMLFVHITSPQNSWFWSTFISSYSPFICPWHNTETVFCSRFLALLCFEKWICGSPWENGVVVIAKLNSEPGSVCLKRFAIAASREILHSLISSLSFLPAQKRQDNTVFIERRTWILENRFCWETCHEIFTHLDKFFVIAAKCSP